MATILSLYPTSAFDAALPALVSIADAEKAALIQDAFAAVHAYLGWAGASPLSARYTEQLDGLGGPTVWVASAPIATVHNVWLDPGRAFNAAAPTPSDADYLVDPATYRVDQSGWGLVRTRDWAFLSGADLAGGWSGFPGGGATGRLNAGRGGWPSGKGVVWVDFTGGWTLATLPAAVKAAVKELIAYGYHVNRQGGVLDTSVRYQDVSVGSTVLSQAFETSGSLANARNLLNRANLVRPAVYATPTFP